MKKFKLSNGFYFRIPSLLLFIVLAFPIWANPVLENTSTQIEGSNVTSITIDKPTGTVESELLLAIISIDGNISVTAPSGWTTIDNGQGNSNAVTLAAYYKITTASEAANYSFTWSGGEQAIGAIMRYSNIDTANPIDVVSAITATGTSNGPTSPDITTVSANTTIVYAYAADSDYGNEANYYPVGTTGVLGDRSSGTGSAATSIGIAEKTLISGNTGTGVFDMRNNNSEEWRAITIILNEPSTDSDGDGIFDSVDLDSDNDGIPDTIECPSGVIYGPELIVNGDFEDGYANWLTDYSRGKNNFALTNGTCSTQGWVAVSPCASTNGICNPYYDYDGTTPDGGTLITDGFGTGANIIPTSNCNQSGNSCMAQVQPDHTTGTGYSVYIDPNNISGEAVWQQTIMIEAGKDYEFSAWIMVIENNPNLEFVIDGNTLTGGMSLTRQTGGSDGPDAWQQISSTWNSGATNGSVIIELTNLVSNCGGNDFRIDDFSLKTISTPDCDIDGDGITNDLDLDSDNDGIPDLVEAGGVDTDGDGKVDGNIDSDGDGTPDYADPDDPSCTLGDVSAPTDGICDNIQGGVDTDSDGIQDSDDYDADGDGLADTYDSDSGGSNITNPDSDNDGIPDINDLDADNDGIPDVVEAGGTDTNGDGIADGFTDSDNDGFNDEVDGDVGNNGAENTSDALIVTGTDIDANGTPDSFVNGDTDGDGLLDQIDLDSDNDGLPDVVEVGGTDTNGDGIADSFVDGDGDGFNDIVDGDPDNSLTTGDDSVDTNTANAQVLTGADTDGDGNPNSYPEDDTDGDDILDQLDLDADNDGIPDVVEAGGTDENGDGIADGFTDADGDGFNDTVDGDPDNSLPAGDDSSDTNTANAQVLTGADTNSDGTPNSYPGDDTDGDGILDHLDLDADNDGIPDVVEAGGTDVNGDGIADGFTDVDGDGFNDTVDGDPDNSLSAGDDSNDTNSADALQPTGADTNGDGTPNSYPEGDQDGDGLLDHIDLDADNDGIPDVVESGGIDIDGNGLADSFADLDNDGFNDTVDGDPNNSLPAGDDSVDTNTANAQVLTGVDSDGDGEPNSFPNDDSDGDGNLDHLDLDADNDGIPDLVEVGGIDIDGDGQVDTNTDVDQDGLADIYDEDATDGPGEDGTNGTALVETNGSGTMVAGDNATDFIDTDGDDLPDHLDLDADNDGIPDLIEAGGHDPEGDGRVDTGAIPWDTDGDGLADIFDTDNNDIIGTGDGGDALIQTNADTNGDGTVNAAGESMVSGGGGDLPINPDGDGAPNHLDIDADNDGIMDVTEVGATDSNNDGNGR